LFKSWLCRGLVIVIAVAVGRFSNMCSPDPHEHMTSLEKDIMAPEEEERKRWIIESPSLQSKFTKTGLVQFALYDVTPWHVGHGQEDELPPRYKEAVPGELVRDKERPFVVWLFVKPVQAAADFNEKDAKQFTKICNPNPAKPVYGRMLRTSEDFRNMFPRGWPKLMMIVANKSSLQTLCPQIMVRQSEPPPEVIYLCEFPGGSDSETDIWRKRAEFVHDIRDQIQDTTKVGGEQLYHYTQKVGNRSVWFKKEDPGKTIIYAFAQHAGGDGTGNLQYEAISRAEGLPTKWKIEK